MIFIFIMASKGLFAAAWNVIEEILSASLSKRKNKLNPRVAPPSTGASWTLMGKRKTAREGERWEKCLQCPCLFIKQQSKNSPGQPFCWVKGVSGRITNVMLGAGPLYARLQLPITVDIPISSTSPPMMPSQSITARFPKLTPDRVKLTDRAAAVILNGAYPLCLSNFIQLHCFLSLKSLILCFLWHYNMCFVSGWYLDIILHLSHLSNCRNRILLQAFSTYLGFEATVQYGFGTAEARKLKLKYPFSLFNCDLFFNKCVSVFK